jgi:PQQ-dependent catabolism-associated CXXCW motif protein
MSLSLPVPTRRRPLATLLLAALAAGPLPVLAQQGFDQPPPAPQQGQPMQPMQQQPMQPMQPMPQGPQGPHGSPPGGMPNQGTANWPPAGNPGGGMQPAPGGYGGAGAPAGGGSPDLQAMVQRELQDYGVAPQPQLQANMHGPTPTSIPGGQVITTDRLLGLYQQGQQNGLLVFHVLGPGPTLPNAQNAAPASQAGSFDDQTQQQFGQYLQQVTQGNTGRPMVFYCLNTQCWMSYNAALRAIRMGYSQVYWYRGGIEAWQQIQQMAGGMGGQPGAMPGQPQGGAGW